MSSTAPEWKSAVIPRYLRWAFGHHIFNSIFYTLTFGSSVFILFLSELGLNKERIGLIMSLFPFCGLIAPFISGAVSRFGLKRTYLTFFGIRKFEMLLLLAAPWILHQFGVTFLFRYTVIVLLAFALMRATAEAAYYPWNREFVPDAVRGRVGGLNNLFTSLGGMLAMLLASAVLGAGQGYGRYQFLIGVACAVGFIGVLTMLPVPREQHAQVASARPMWREMGDALRDRRFRGFLVGVMASILAMAGYTFLPLFARERLGLPEARIVLFDAANTVGGLLFSLYWGRAADRYGGKPLTLATLATLGALPLLWLLLPLVRPAAFLGGVGLSFICGAASGGLGIGSFRWFLVGVVPLERRTAYTSLWYAGSGLAGGAAPFLAGWLLHAFGGWTYTLGRFSVDAFALLFGLALAITLVSLTAYHKVPAEGEYRTRDYVWAVVSQDIPRALAWITTRGRKN